MMTQNIAALMRYRMEQAEEALAAARLLQRERSLQASVNRSYSGAVQRASPHGGYPMKLIGIREARERLSAMVTRAQRERVVLTRHGRPAALLIGIEGVDLEEVLLRSDEQFWSELAEQRRRNDTVSEAEAMRILDLPAPTGPTGSRRTRR